MLFNRFYWKGTIAAERCSGRQGYSQNSGSGSRLTITPVIEDVGIPNSTLGRCYCDNI